MEARDRVPVLGRERLRHQSHQVETGVETVHLGPHAAEAETDIDPRTNRNIATGGGALALTGMSAASAGPAIMPAKARLYSNNKPFHDSPHSTPISNMCYRRVLWQY